MVPYTHLYGAIQRRATMIKGRLHCLDKALKTGDGTGSNCN